jgi:YjbE family integral membrane protein
VSEIWNHFLADMSALGSPSALAALGQVLMIAIVLSGDNVIVVGALAAGLPRDQRRKAIYFGITVALVLRIAFALVATRMMQFVGLIFAGGLLLLWVGWKMYRGFHEQDNPGSPEIVGDEHSGLAPAKSFASAAWAIAAADVSMSLDNVLGVAGAARQHPGIMVMGLVLSVVLMGIAANVLARYIERYRWIGYVGLLVILYVAGRMIYDGIVDAEFGLISLI